METDEQRLAAMLNLGEKTASWLISAGISSPEELRRLGAIEAARRVFINGQNCNAILVYAHEGALSGLHWNKLEPERRSELKLEYELLKRDS